MTNHNSISTLPAKRLLILGALFIALLTLGVYGHGLGNALVFDDERLRDGVIDGYGALWPWRQRLLSYGSFVWVQQWFGAEQWAVQRAVNVALHLAASLAVGMLTHALLTQWLRRYQHEWLARSEASALDAALEQRLSPQQLQARLGAALLIAVGWFALNPVAVYATAYLVQRSILMATLFTALACWAWVRGWQTQAAGRRWAWLALAAGMAALAFLSKEHAVLVPLLAVPLYVYVRRPAPARLLAVLALALLAMALLAAALWPRFSHLLGAASFDATSAVYVRSLDSLHPGAAAHAYGLSLLNQTRLFFVYLGHWLLPYPGALSIDMRPVFPLHWLSGWHLAGALAFVLAGVASLWALLKRPGSWGLLGLCTLCAMLLFGTELLTTWIQDPFVLYRSYLWAIFLPTGMALALLTLPRQLVLGAGAAALLVLAALSYERVDTFKTPYTVWNDAAEKVDLQAPPNAFGRWRPFMNRGSFHLEHGENAQAALTDFERAVALGEPLGSAQFSRGMALQMLGRHPEAVQAFHAAEQQGFKDAALYYQAASALRAMGVPQNALTAIAEGLKHRPDSVTKTHLLLLRAEILTQAGQHAAAAQDYQALLADAPDHGKYLVGLGMAHLAQGQYPQAQAQFEKALALREDASAYFARALLHMRTGNLPAARADADRAVALDTNNPLFVQLQQQLQGPAAPQAGPLRSSGTP
ncbi:tetratricopeptide repeat protein [Vandammella animalimorsus]|uniref:tetratricopeptide repeat protein n=1 Tax=Vandammella animalimorsus TaxID=2029117 RepID=UPI0031BB8F06